MQPNTITQEYLKEDFIAETDNYLTDLATNKKRDLYLRISMGVVYTTLLVVSLFVV